MKLITFIILALYAGVGALVHVLLAGLFFNPASMLSWACLLGWPVVLFVGGFCLAFVVFCIGVFFVWVWGVITDIPVIAAWRHRRWEARFKRVASANLRSRAA